jgi:diguanylate cyclase (GGDEF)-like protein
MTRFDLPTVIAYSGLMACIMGLILHCLGKNYPTYIRGLGCWTAAPLVAGLATLTRLWLRSDFSDSVAIGAQNVCLITTAGFFLAGTCQFFERTLPRRFLPLLIGVSVFAMWLFSGYEGAEIHRRLFARTLLIILYAYLAWVIYRQPNTSARRLTVSTVASLVGLILVRTIVGYISPDGDGVDSLQIVQVVYAIGFSSTDVLIPICAILMISEKLRITLENLAMRDSLTGLLTRRALFEFGESELASCRRRGVSLSVLMLDLDHFKEINDNYGHHVGDSVIRDFAERTQSILRRSFVLARYGGEEFVAVLPETNATDAALIAERIRSRISANPDNPELPQYHVSIGVATTLATGNESLTVLIQKADQGLYQAKQRGRNRIEVMAA